MRVPSPAPLPSAASGAGQAAHAGQEAGRVLTSEDMRLLVDLGFMALSHGAAADAEAIFSGVVAARPQQEAGYLGLALIRLHAGAVDEAVAILRRLPPSDAARLFLGLALNRQGEPGEARAILADVASTSADGPFARNARDLLDAMSATP